MNFLAPSKSLSLLQKSSVLTTFCAVLCSLCLGGFSELAFAKKPLTLKQARSTFESYDFPKASSQFKSLLKSKSLRTRSERAEAHMLLGLSLYNMAKFKESRRAFQQALRLKNNLKLLPGQSPVLVSLFEKIRLQEKKRLASRPKSNSKAKQPALRVAVRKRSPARRVAPKSKVVLKPKVKPRVAVIKRKVKSRVAVRKTSQKPARPVLSARKSRVAPKGFLQRHKWSLSLFVVGGAVLVSGVGVGIGYQLQNNAYTAVNNDTTRSAFEVENAYREAFTTGVTSTILMSTGGVVVGAGLAFLLYESLRARPAAPLPASKAPTSPRPSSRSRPFLRQLWKSP